MQTYLEELVLPCAQAPTTHTLCRLVLYSHTHYFMSDYTESFLDAQRSVFLYINPLPHSLTCACFPTIAGLPLPLKGLGKLCNLGGMQGFARAASLYST